MKPHLTRLLLLLSVLSFSFFSTAQNSITGTITDENGLSLIGASILIKGTTTGTITDENGRFSLLFSEAFPVNLVINYVGYTEKIISISANTSDLNISLEEEGELLEVIVAASRKREKMQESPSSVSVISSNMLRVSPTVNPVSELANLRGVQVLQLSANRLNIEMRGDADIFNTSVFPIKDYRMLLIPGIDVFTSSGMGLSQLDMNSIEVVRGPGSALYGPGVTSGVVHFITKNPIAYPGTAVELTGGELNTLGISARHATKVSDKFGFKINASYNQGDEFNYDMSNEADAEIIRRFRLKNVIVSPFINEDGLLVPPVFDATGQLVDLNGGVLLEENVDKDGDGNPLLSDYYNLALNTTLEFRPLADWSVFLSGGYENFNEFLHNGTSGPQIQYRQVGWTQLRSQYKGLFAAINYTTTTGQANGEDSHIYQTGLVTKSDRGFWDTQLQYNFQVPKFLDADISVGGDFRSVSTNTHGLVNGRFENKDDYRLWGTYAQGKFSLAPTLDLVLAGRFDGNNILDESTISPRIALIYKADKNHTIRGSFNRASSPPGALQLFIDLPIQQLPFGNIWATQAQEGTTFDHINLLPPGAPNIPIETPGLPVPLAAVHAQINANAIALLSQNPNLPAPVLAFLNNYTPSGEVLGTLIAHDIATLNLLNPADFQFTSLMADNVNRLERPANIKPIKNEYYNVYELGYSGKIFNKFKIDLDAYYIKREGFTRGRVVGALYGLDGVGAALGNDIAQQLVLNFGFTPEQAAPIAAVYGGLGNAATAVYGIADGDQVPQNPSANIPFTYQSFDESIDYFGTDFSLTYLYNEALSAYVNYSWLSQNEWISGTSDDDGLTDDFYLNTPKNKFNVGLNYIPESGFNGSLRFRHVPSFDFNSGLYYNGETDEQNLVDLTVGYRFSNKLQGLGLSLSATNLLDREYRAAPDFPRIGRRVLGKLSYAF